MTPHILNRRILAVATALIVTILVLVPFHAFLTVWAASIFGHYTAWRLWDEALLAIIVILVIFSLCLEREVTRTLSRHWLWWLIAAYIVLELIYAAVVYGGHEVTAKAVGYGLLVNLRFLFFFMVCWVAAGHTKWLKEQWRRLILIPAALVIGFGLMQFFVLPYDFLRHFGYGPQTIKPYETINNNLHYRRVIATLRGANPLGAYLVIIASMLPALLLRVKNRRWQMVYGGYGVAAAIVLFLSYSRGAWLGAAIAVVIVVYLLLRKPGLWRWGLVGLFTLVILSVAGAWLFKDNPHWQNIITHTQSHTAAKTTSDQGHLSSLKAGLKDLVRQPFGEGPGTAGPANVYNDRPARLAENYFVQVGQEVGWLGLMLFLAINGGVAWLLWQRRTDPLALTLFASLIGLTLVNLLSHAWTDDTLAYLWWGLAGIAIGTAANSDSSKSLSKITAT